MELNEILNRLVELLPEVDSVIEVPRTNRNNQYIPCVGTANEPTFVRTFMQSWNDNYPDELPDIIIENRSRDCPQGSLEVHYNLEEFDGATADVAFSTNSSPFDDEVEWLIEFKKIEFVGDTGGKNLHQEVSVAKLFSPFLSHTRGVLHDMNRITQHPLGRRKAVIIYAFSLDHQLITHAESHPRRREQIHPDRTIDRGNQLRRLMRNLEDEPFSLVPMLTPFEGMCEHLNHELGERIHHQFDGLQNHPFYVQGDFVAWEIN